jgi:hypothetical protein
VRLAEEGTHWGRGVPEASSAGLVDIWDLMGTPLSPGTADPADKAGREAGKPWAAAPRRLALPVGAAFDHHRREAVGSAYRRGCLVGVPLFPSDNHLSW